MTAKFSAHPSQVTITSGNQPVANLTATAGIAFCKNKLFNGEVTRINQRGFDGNWTPKGTWTNGNTIAQQELCYGWDMWAKASATDMLQVIEAGNFRPSTVHTLSGTGVTTQQITSPASGNWNITVPQTARNVQVEEGAEATPFEIRPISFELAQCQRYYEKMALGGTSPSGATVVATNSASAPNPIFTLFYKAAKRTVPSIKDNGQLPRYVANTGIYNAGAVTTYTPFIDCFVVAPQTGPAASLGFVDNLGDIYISAVI